VHVVSIARGPRTGVDESGSGLFTNTSGFTSALPSGLLTDPGPGGLANALTYGLLNPPDLVTGDLLVQEVAGGPLSDLIRFNPSQSCLGTTGCLVFYSDNLDGADAIADIGFPTALYTNTVTLLEIGFEGGLQGVIYTPTARAHMVHQCMSEHKWFTGMLGIDVGGPPIPAEETRLAFIRRYAQDSAQRLARLAERNAEWWGQDVAFFDTMRSRAWVMVRRIAHTAHHRAEQTTLLRLLGRQVWSVYGPSVDTGGLPANGARTIYPYPSIDRLIVGETRGGEKAVLPGLGPLPSTERPPPS